MSTRASSVAALEPRPAPTDSGSYDPQGTPTPSQYFIDREHLYRPWAEHWVRFERDMKRIGLDVHECQGPNGWGGPAVTVPPETLRDVMTATRVKLDTHDVGDLVMAYPAPVWI